MPVEANESSQFFPSNCFTVSDWMCSGSMHAAVIAYPSGLLLHTRLLRLICEMHVYREQINMNCLPWHVKGGHSTNLAVKVTGSL